MNDLEYYKDCLRKHTAAQGAMDIEDRYVFDTRGKRVKMILKLRDTGDRIYTICRGDWEDIPHDETRRNER